MLYKRWQTKRILLERPAVYAMQLGYANHLKVLCSKGMVLNVQAKGSVKTLSGACKEAECK